MTAGYPKIEIAAKAEAAPVALAAQRANLLGCSAMELKQAIDELILTNPLVEPPDDEGDTHPAAFARARRETLAEHISSQLRMTVSDPELLRLSLFIANSLDADGYLREDADALCRLCRCDAAFFQQALCQVQRTEPAGIGARNLAECLRLQLEAAEPVNPLAVRIVSEHLEALANHTLTLSDESEASVQEAVRQILTLNPRPGSAFDDAPIPYLFPDILVTCSDGRLSVSLMNQPRLPALCGEYAAIVRSCRGEERQYVREKLAYARSFLFAIRQRSSTLLAIAALAVERQSDHLIGKPPAPLRPLTQTGAAETLGISASTVSRGIRGKYVQFGSSVFPLKALFTAGGTARRSRQEIVERIRRICCAGSGRISDRAVAEALVKDGIRIARRTVNKYRAGMGEERS